MPSWELRRDAAHADVLRAEPGIVLAEQVLAFRAPSAAQLVIGGIGNARNGFFHPLRARLTHVEANVMHDGRITRPHFGRDNPLVLGEIDLHQNVLILDRAPGRNVEVLRPLDDHVGHDIPAVGEGHGRGPVFRVAFGRAGIHPGGNGGYIGGAQALVIFDMGIAVVGIPWRHLFADHRRFDGFRPTGGRQYLLSATSAPLRRAGDTTGSSSA